ncbi:FecCD family ABC transporter permease [Microbacterium gorillae]|uniref:FecCD family ABC transporter permease n=1 Tax=Microbacterium gorillae TaxID=1231063 RepID=UPI00058D8425|nr:iron chelate uptake ABC transporter family permease subunit [Microbacterium gorillae]
MSAPDRFHVLRFGSLSLRVQPRLAIVSAVLLVLTAVLGVISLTVGTLAIPFGDVLATLFGDAPDVRTDRVVLGLRLPRTVTAIFAGAALGVSGAIFQSVSRNALGSPDVIGFTTGAATGAIVQIVVFRASALQVSIAAVVGGLLTAVVVYLLSRKAGVTGGFRLILVGIGVGAVLSAVNSLLLVTGDLDDATSANLWLAGSLCARTWMHALPVLIGTVVLIPIVALLARRATLMEMGDDLAQQLGIRVEPTRVGLMLLAVALAGLATGAAGPIAFVALAAPQLVTRLTRSRAVPVVSAAAMGAVLLVLADTVAQTLPINAALPIGRMTGIIGGIYLIWLLTRAKQV